MAVKFTKGDEHVYGTKDFADVIAAFDKRLDCELRVRGEYYNVSWHSVTRRPTYFNRAWTNGTSIYSYEACILTRWYNDANEPVYIFNAAPFYHDGNPRGRSGKAQLSRTTLKHQQLTIAYLKSIGACDSTLVVENDYMEVSSYDLRDMVQRAQMPPAVYVPTLREYLSTTSYYTDAMSAARRENDYKVPKNATYVLAPPCNEPNA